MDNEDFFESLAPDKIELAECECGCGEQREADDMYRSDEGELFVDRFHMIDRDIDAAERAAEIRDRLLYGDDR